MSIRATSPYTLYLDADGTPLTGGYVYFGVAGSNPETTPIAAYWDEALTIAAAQPLRTINGFIMRNGSPGSIYTAAAYSVTVKNKNGALVFSALTNPGIPFSLAMLPVCSAASLAAGLTAFGFSAFVQTLIDDADAATFLATLGLTVTAYAKTLLDDADAATARATLGALGATEQAVEAAGVRETGAGAVLLKPKVIEIGDWDMDANAAIYIAHGLTAANIRSVSASIVSDNAAMRHPIPTSNLANNGSSGTETELDLFWGATNVTLYRRTGGDYDNDNYDSTSYNRGWVTIWYVA